ncbi:MAG: glycosyltransferase family 2 protein [Bacteroidota bacterium]|nr:glycosyltransferase family 2 protein [Bacteroidota bacterium]
MSVLSIITINYNNKAGLEKTILSVISQSDKSFEFIVIDGGSTDGSVDVIERHKLEITYSVSEKDNGIYNAQNKGIAKAKGDYCLFLNSGDTLANEQVFKDIKQHLTGTDIVYGDLITVDPEGKKEHLRSPEELDAPHFMVSTLWHPTAFIKRKVFEKFGAYNETLKITGDYEFFIRAVLKHKVSTKHISLPICIFDLSGISNSEKNNELQATERKKSWQLNYTDAEVETFEKHTRYVRSRQYKVDQLFKKIFKPFSK